MKILYRIMSILICIVVFISFTAATVSGIDTDVSNYRILGSIGGSTSAVAVSSNHVYVGKGTSIIVLENTDGRLTEKGTQVNLPSFISDLTVNGKTLYAAVGTAGLYIIDISDPLNPKIKSNYSSAGFAEGVAVTDTNAYLADGIEGMQIIDILDPCNPALKGQIYKGKYAFSIAVNGDCAYIAAADDGLLIADISESSAPKELAAYNTPGVARYVDVSDQYAYVADDWKGVSVIDISTPATPRKIKTINTAGRAHGLTIDKDILYVADAYMGIRVFNIKNINSPKDLTSFIPADSQMVRIVADKNLIFCADRVNGILCFNASKPEDLKLKGLYSHSIPIPLELPKELTYWDNQNAIARLIVLGIVDGSNLDLERGITRAEFAELLCKGIKADVSVNKGKTTFRDVPADYWAYNYIETAARLGLIIPRDKTHFAPDETLSYGEVVTSLLRLVNREPKKGTWPQNCIKEAEKLGINTVLCRNNDDLIVQRPNAFAMLEKVISEITDTKTGMTLLQSKFGIKLQASPMSAVDVAINGSYAYEVSGTSGFSVIDIMNPANMYQVAHLDFPDSVMYVRINGRYAYVFSTNTIYVIDISNPLYPIRTYSVTTHEGGPVRGISFDSGRIYIADEWGVKIYSIADPARPVLLAFHQILGEDRFGFFSCTSDIAVRNGIAYIAYEMDGTVIYDLSDADNPKYIGAYTDSNNFMSNVQFNNNLAFVKSGARIDILDIKDIMNPRLIGTIGNADSQQFNYKAGIYGNTILLPNDSNGILAADISDPEAARVVGTIDTTGIPINVTVSGSKAYIADSLGGLTVLNLSQAVNNTGKAEAEKSTQAGTSCEFNTYIFEGPNAESYVLTSEKAEAVIIKSQKQKFTQTLTVSNKAESGKGSLKWCLDNIKEGGRILFDTKVFPPSRPTVIYSLSGINLDRVNNITIDASNAGVIIDGSNAQPDCTGIMISTSGNVIKGLQVQNFKNNVLSIYSKGNIIGGDRYTGKGPSGEGNVFIYSGGVSISGRNTTDNILVGNNIGVMADGKTPAGNKDGIAIRELASRNIIGIDKPEYRNVISANESHGISTMCNGYGNLIEGNYIGTDITGTIALGNYYHGISFELGGFGTIVRNNISCANGRNGILLWDNNANYNVIIGNSIGIGADGRELHNYEGSLTIGGGVGGGSCYNVIGDNNAEYQNKCCEGYIASFGNGSYDTITNGKVCKYMDKDRY